MRTEVGIALRPLSLHDSMRTWIMFRFFLTIVLWLSFETESFGLESRVYKCPKDCSKVVQVWNRTDQTVECRGSVDKLSLVSPPKDPSKSVSWVRREDDKQNPALFTRVQVRKLLDDEPHKDLLFVTIRGEHGGDGLYDYQFKELEKFTVELGYKRVVIIGWPDSNSIYVYRDTQDDTLKSEKRPAEKVK